MRKNNGFINQNNVTSLSFAISAALVQPNTNFILHMARKSQLRTQMTALLAVFTQTTTTTISIATVNALWLTNKKMEKLKKFECCFKCKNKSHMAPQCMWLARLYLVVSTTLQKIMFVENASDLRKK